MAPEQHRGAPIDHRADIWAMGAIVYEMVTGRLPYQDDGPDRSFLTGPEIFHRMMTRPITDPRRFNPAITEDFAKAVMKALDNEPIHRPGSARGFALMLAEATPGDVDAPSGIEILKQHAAELLQGDDLLETKRSPPPVMDAAARGYEIGARLGIGGMAEVFRATVRGAAGFTRTVALKRVLAGFSELPQFAAMFIEEARIAMRLVHENIVSVGDFNQDEDGRFYLVMELVDGKDLAALIETGKLPPTVAVFIAIKMLRGLGYAHELPMPATNTRGVIHRDISPHNVLASWQGAIKVSDFGIAKARDADGAVRSLLLKGKPAYMSPEQANGEPLDPRSDLFAVGVVLWEMLTGQRLFEGGTKETFAKIFFRDAPLVSSCGVQVSGELDRVVRKLLAREKDERYTSAAATLEELTACPENPRDGENELARLLAARFPREASTVPPIEYPQTAAAPRVAPAVPLSTLGATASQVLGVARQPGAARSSGPRRGWLAAGLILVSAAAVAVVLTVTHDPQRASSREPAVSAPPPQPSVPDTASSSAADPDAATVAARMIPPDARLPDATLPDAATDAPVHDAPIADATVPLDARPQPPVRDAGTPDARPAAGSATPGGTGRLRVVILPWAEVWIDGKPFGQAPITVKLAAGPHRLRMKNDNKDKTITVIVTTSKTTLIDETW